MTQEAVISSRIEGTRATLEEVLEYEADPKEKRAPEKVADIQEIINYRNAMWLAIEEMKNRPLCLNLVRDLHRALLNAISGQDDWNGWIRFFLTAMVEQAEANSAKARAVPGLYERMKQIVPEITHSQYAIQAIDAVFRHPVFQSTDFISSSSIPRDSALRILNSLKERKIIGVVREGKGRRPAIMAFMELIEIAEGSI